MMRLAARPLTILLLASTPSFQQIAPVQVLSITAGPAGSESNGGFALTEERAIFSRATDREVIVLFRWDDVPGAHKLVAQWRSPDGGASVNSAIDYKAAEKRFGAVWRLPVSPGMALGTWSIDVSMDGRPAGRFTFEVTDAKVEAAAVKRPLTEAEIYARLHPGFVVLRRSRSDGVDLDPAAAFMAAPQTGRLHTVVAAIDSADVIRQLSADRPPSEVVSLVSWSRSGHWAVLAGQPAAGAALPVKTDTVKIGSRCYSMEGSTSGLRVLVAGTITGQAGTIAGQPAWVATFANAFGMPGAPVVDEYGELFGIVGAGVPGDQRPMELLAAARGDLKGAPVIPISVVEGQPTAPPAALTQLRSGGALMPAVGGGAHVASGGFARSGKRDAGKAFLDTFTSADKQIVVAVAWAPAERVRGQAAIRVFDAENKPIGASQPKRVNYGKGNYVESRWEIPAPPRPGMYRVDVTVDATTYWRGFFRLDP